MPDLPFTIRFGANGDYKLWAGEGWHHDPDDKDHTWAGHVAKLRFMLEYTKSDLLLQLDLIPVRAGGTVQELFVFLNGSFVAFWPVRQYEQKSGRIEASFFNSHENLFTFVAPRAICPKEERMSNDQRILGLAFRTFSLSAV